MRSSLAGVILWMKSLKLGLVEDFPFIEPPPRKAVDEVLRALREAQAH